MSRKVFKALNSEPRLRILELLSNRLLNVSEIAQALDMPLSTTTSHISILEASGLIRTELKPGERGLQKLCQRVYDRLLIELPGERDTPPQQIIELSMPIGAYTDFSVTPTCGLVNDSSMIGFSDDPTSFYEPGHTEAQLIWFHQGYVEYKFPNRLPPRVTAESLWLSMEVCSEAPMHHLDWPSDITLWLNGVEIGTWTSPADFGGQRGVLTPDWWSTRSTQYGLLKEWRVNSEGSYVDGVKVSEVCLADLSITDNPFILLRVGVKPDARHIGGINIFGKKFGNYAQDIVMRIQYHH
jgi:predicted transcriptional regulator